MPKCSRFFSHFFERLILRRNKNNQSCSIVGPFNGDCSFETSLGQCQWTQSAGDDGDWTIASTTLNGPKRDHRNTATGDQQHKNSLMHAVLYNACIS